jgi:C1A family cysteine protease
MAAIAGAGVLLFSMGSKTSNSKFDIELDAQFRQFKKNFSKDYLTTQEDSYRRGVFAETLKRIAAHNAKKTTFSLGITKFSDLNAEERRAQYLSKFPVQKNTHCAEPAYRLSNDDSDEVDWQAQGKVQAVKDQKQCGSCWAFAAIGALESSFAIFQKIDVPSLSEQELVDCSHDYGNDGCNGGLPGYGYNYILDHKINTEDKYPYKGQDKKCKSISGKGDFAMKGCVKVQDDVNGLIDAIRVQPVAVGFYVQDDFFDYTGGVYDPVGCDDQPNHGVVAVGFNISKDQEKPFFKVKNSWGTGWGEEGYFRVATGEGKGTCDIAGNGCNFYPSV